MSAARVGRPGRGGPRCARPVPARWAGRARFPRPRGRAASARWNRSNTRSRCVRGNAGTVVARRRGEPRRPSTSTIRIDLGRGVGNARSRAGCARSAVRRRGRACAGAAETRDRCRSGARRRLVRGWPPRARPRRGRPVRGRAGVSASMVARTRRSRDQALHLGRSARGHRRAAGPCRCRPVSRARARGRPAAWPAGSAGRARRRRRSRAAAGPRRRAGRASRSWWPPAGRPRRRRPSPATRRVAGSPSEIAIDLGADPVEAAQGAGRAAARSRDRAPATTSGTPIEQGAAQGGGRLGDGLQAAADVHRHRRRPGRSRTRTRPGRSRSPGRRVRRRCAAAAAAPAGAVRDRRPRPARLGDAASTCPSAADDLGHRRCRRRCGARLAGRRCRRGRAGPPPETATAASEAAVRRLSRVESSSDQQPTARTPVNSSGSRPASPAARRLERRVMARPRPLVDQPVADQSHRLEASGARTARRSRWRSCRT